MERNETSPEQLQLTEYCCCSLLALCICQNYDSFDYLNTMSPARACSCYEGQRNLYSTTHHLANSVTSHCHSYIHSLPCVVAPCLLAISPSEVPPFVYLNKHDTMPGTCSFTPFPILTTERLVLRRVTMNDDKEIFFQRSDASMNKYVNNPLAQTIDDAQAWMEKIDTIIDTNEGISWGVTLKGDDKLVGGFCYWNWEKEQEKAEIGFGIYPPHQNKGLMQELLEAGLKFGFEYMGLKVIEAYTHPENAPSITVLEKSSFRFRGMSEDDNCSVYELTAG